MATTRQNVSRLVSNNAASAAETREQKPKAMLWLNVGYMAVDNAGNETFIGLPMGIPLDTQDPVELRGSNEEYLHLQRAKNQLLEDLKSFVGGFDPASDSVLDGLVVQARRGTAPAEKDEPGSNPYMKSLKSLGFASKAS